MDHTEPGADQGKQAPATPEQTQAITEQQAQMMPGQEAQAMPEQQTQAIPVKPQRAWLKPLIAAIVMVVIAAGSFFIGVAFESGRKSAANNAATAPQTQQLGPGQSAPRNGPFTGNGQRVRAIGTVTAINSSSISIKNARDNSTSTYSITNSTLIQNNGQNASASDIKVGDTVIILTDASQSNLATSIMINPPNIRNGGNSGSSS
jgi:hypothetical protein